MPLLLIKFPEKRWRKVNVSKFLKRFKSVPASKVVEVPEEELDRVIEILKRNKCEVQVLEPVKDDVEVKVLKELLKRIEAIRLNLAEPIDLERLAVDAIAKFSLENMSEELSELLHDCVDFAENPTITNLNEIESRVKELLKERLAES